VKTDPEVEPTARSLLRQDDGTLTGFKHRLEATRARFRISLYNVGYRIAGSLDGYPLPPARLVDLAIGTRELAWYQLGGMFMHQAITGLLRRNGAQVDSLESILDFGCGCGRILRWWAAIREQTEIWGCDYNADLIAWCQRKLSTIAQFKVNDLDPPLEFPDEKFEFVYSYSVLTHLSREKQMPWLEELVRVTQRGGFLLLTVHGKRVALRSGVSSQQLQQLEDQGVVVFEEEKSGSSHCTAYHSEGYMTGLQPLGLKLVDFLPGGARDTSEQDIYLFRRAQSKD
jgi:ubiquinone/menaquinone biosynthesis C-methylase UbiE